MVAYIWQESNWKKPRGVQQRNTALQWIRNNLKAGEDRGVIYFADDDNTYGLEVFDEVYLASITVSVIGLIFLVLNILHNISDHASNV